MGETTPPTREAVLQTLNALFLKYIDKSNLNFNFAYDTINNS